MPPVASTAATTVDSTAFFAGLLKRTSTVPRILAALPAQLPMGLLSTYTTLPLFSALGYALCPSPTQLAQGLAAALGCLSGTGVGAFLDRAKKDAARCSVLQLLSEHAAAPSSELRALVEGVRRRFGVAPGRPAAEAFEDTALGSIYEDLLTQLLEGPANDAGDLPALQRLKAVLALDGIVAGVAHKRAAQLLSAKGERLEGERMTRAVDKLLFLSERTFSDDESEEAEIFEMNRIRKVLKVTEREARQRIGAVSRALYQQNLSAVADQVDGHTGIALAGASAAFGLPSDEAARMNGETYRQIAANLLESGKLAPKGNDTLEKAKGVLQLGDRAATLAFEAVACPMLRKDVDSAAEELRAEAPASAERVEAAAAMLATRRKELGLSAPAAELVATEGLLAAMRSLYDAACKDARINGDEAALRTLDKMLAFAGTAGAVLSSASAAEVKENGATAVEAPLLTFPADTAAARRLYGLYLERSFSGDAPDAKSPEELASMLELSEADEEVARVEVCQPRLRKLYVDSIARAEAQPAALPLAKAALGAEMAKFRLPREAAEETAMEVYKSRLEPVADRILKAPEKASLDAARGFLGLTELDVRVLHLKAFSRTFEQSVLEAMGRGGIMSPEAKEALEQLRERLGLSEDDAEQIFHSVVQARMNNMMEKVRDAYEEATYTKEALAQIWKERGKDVGDDPSTDGTGAEFGIKDVPQLEGVRGFSLMTELTDVADFYVRNKVVVQMKDMPPEYPVTVGKMFEEKVKEEMYGVYAWNAVTCQDSGSRDRWERAKPHVGGILGLSPEKMEKVLVRMVSRWCNMFIKQKIQENGKLGEDDVSTLTNWVPTFFGIDKDVTKDMVQGANKGLLVSKAMKLLNKPSVSREDVQGLRDEVETWDLQLEKDLELTRPQLRSLFRVEVTAVLEDEGLSTEQKQDSVDSSRDAFGLSSEEAADELKDLLQARAQGCLVNAVGDLMQGNDNQAVTELRRLELLASFVSEADGLELCQDWEVAPSMRQKLLKVYAGSAQANQNGAQPDVGLLERTLGLATAQDP